VTDRRRGKRTRTCDGRFPRFPEQRRNTKSIMQDNFEYTLILYSAVATKIFSSKIAVCECTQQWRRPTVVPRYLSPRIGSPTYGRASGRYYYWHYNTAATGGPAAVVRCDVVVRQTRNAVLIATESETYIIFFFT